ncbi:NAD(P)/FAD-dependent oxidoreductase [Roseobacter sp. CCS2]|uniref:NAD(P)/FAD-dependent oxidoreductase n=1 Tax=Roseobacter sp. CCS2 TaxID=391593 RepID=UPI0000F3E378|nr:FAD-binding oxidoreductase [Roseobacter sp. CCS2]EBA11953.1 oxidoreductase, FAD-binding protein [Roseobacter sp. CCS2]
MDLLTANDRQGKYPPSYYADAAEHLDRFPAAAGDLTCDVCVVGAGFTGLSTAYHLAQRGYDVMVVEAQRVGFGASGRNGGQVATGQRRDQDELENMVGDAHARELWDIGCQAVDLVRDLCAKDEVHTTFHPGIVHTVHRKRDYQHGAAYVDHMQSKYGYEKITLLEPEACRDIVNSPAYHGGALDMGSGHVQPLELVLGLARLAVKSGARICEQSKVTGIDQGDPATVRTDGATIKARYVVLGCNGYLGTMQKHVAARVMPINNFIVATKPMTPEAQEQIIRNNYAVADSKFVVNYFRFSDDHRLLFGGSESYGYKFPKDIAAAVRKPMTEIFPQLANIGIDHAWGGTLGITMNRMPHYERIGGNILTMSGFSGSGVALGTMSGQIAAEAIAGQAERFDVMARVPTTPFPGGPALRSPLLVLAMLWYGLRDRL